MDASVTVTFLCNFFALQFYLFLPYVPLHVVDMLLEHRHQEGDVSTSPLEMGRRFVAFCVAPQIPSESEYTSCRGYCEHSPFPSENVGTPTSEPPAEGHLEAVRDTELEGGEATSRPFT
ncbi:hypothetical protein ECG_03612 [Echinococcus granulosus]|nr:hypothetical protein ECG_03612 [Echinococcus granulosus]